MAYLTSARDNRIPRGTPVVRTGTQTHLLLLQVFYLLLLHDIIAVPVYHDNVILFLTCSTSPTNKAKSHLPLIPLSKVTLNR